MVLMKQSVHREAADAHRHFVIAEVGVEPEVQQRQLDQQARHEGERDADPERAGRERAPRCGTRMTCLTVCFSPAAVVVPSSTRRSTPRITTRISTSRRWHRGSDDCHRRTETTWWGPGAVEVRVATQLRAHIVAYETIVLDWAELPLPFRFLR